MSNGDYTEGNGDRDMTDLEKQAAAAAGLPQPVYTPHGPNIRIDIDSLAKAQARYINEQTSFFMQPGDYGTQEYLTSLRNYSRAQTSYIAVLQNVLHQADIL